MRTVLLVLLFFIAFGATSYDSSAQGEKRYQGKYGAKKKLFGGHKQKYKHIKKRPKRKKLAQRSHQAAKRRKSVQKRRKKAWNGKKKSLYSSSKNNKRRKGKYPRSKNDLASKASAMVFTGVVVTNQGEPINQEGQVKNVFASYRPGPTLGVGLAYNYTDQLSLVGKAYAYPLRQENFKMDAVTVGIDLKYNIIPSREAISPYFCAGLTYSFAGITKKGFDITEAKDSTYSVYDGNAVNNDYVLVVEEVSRDPQISTNVVPMMGYKLAVGVDFKITRKLKGFVQVDYDHSFAKENGQLKSFFPNNSADFKFVSINGGIRIDLFKSKSLY